MERLAAEVAQRPLMEAEAERIHRSARALFILRSREMLARRNAEREFGWDATPYRSCPSNLRGLKPITQEPWSRDALVYARKTGSFEKIFNADMFGDGTQAQEAYNDESIYDSNNPDAAKRYRSTVTATGLKKNASLGGQPLWDSSVRRYCPHILRGINPVTREPWAVDEQFYNRNSTRDTTLDARAGGGDFELGSISHATRARARQVDRPGFYMPNWEKWSASLSA